MNKIIIFIIFLLQILFLVNFMQCKNFNEAFFLHTRDVNLQLGGDIHADKQPVWLVRIFHNKFEAYTLAVYDNYFYFFSFPFLLSFLSPAGLFGMLTGFYFFPFRGKSKKQFLLLAPVLLVPAIELFAIPKIPYIITLAVLWVAFQLFSLYGYSQFLKQDKNKFALYATVSILVLMSVLWYLFYNDGLGNYCHLTHPANHFPFF